MLCFPMEKKPDWRHPPVITILLIVINVVCFLSFQLDDEVESKDARQYYFKIGLDKIELPRFYDYAIKNYAYKDGMDLKAAKENLEKEKFEYMLSAEMFSDGSFMSKLHNGEIITKKDPVFVKWKQLRKKADSKWNEITYYRYGLKPNKADIETYITSMFLHAGFEHLFWNMVFLFLFGFIVEMAIGWKIFLPAYLLAGIGSGLLYVLMESDSSIPGIGASGAIAGLAGMYTVLFGLRKVRFFVYLFFYFDMVRLPAIIMLPVWVGYEFYNHYFVDSSVNNLAHAGGYITGAWIIVLLKAFKRKVNEDYLDDEIQKEEFTKQYLRGQQYLAALEFDKAGKLFSELGEAHPENMDIKRSLFNISKVEPASNNFHRYAQELLSLTGVDAQTVKNQREVFTEYVAKARPGPKLNQSILTRLAIRFAKRGYFDEADRIVRVLLKNKIKSNEIVELLILLIQNMKIEKPDKARQYHAELMLLAPEKARQILE